MERVVGVLFVAWLIVLALGVVIALMPVFAFVAGFAAVLLAFAFLGRWASSWLW